MDDVVADVAQQKRSNNKCYTSAFRYTSRRSAQYAEKYDMIIFYWIIIELID